MLISWKPFHFARKENVGFSNSRSLRTNSDGNFFVSSFRNERKFPGYKSRRSLKGWRDSTDRFCRSRVVLLLLPFSPDTLYRNNVSGSSRSSRRAGNDAFQTSSLFLFLFFLPSFPSRFFHDQRGIDRLFFPFCPFYPPFFFYTFLDRICAARLPAAGRDDRSREFGNMAEARIRGKWRESVA